MAANNEDSRQYTLVTHLYQYFGKALGCSSQSSDDDAAFSNYEGSTSMSNVHRFMNLNVIENAYFIQEVSPPVKIPARTSLANASLPFSHHTRSATLPSPSASPWQTPQP